MGMSLVSFQKRVGVNTLLARKAAIDGLCHALDRKPLRRSAVGGF